MSDDPRRRPGRPSLGVGPSPAVHVRMAGPVFDAAHRRAQVERRNLPDLVRRAVAHYVAAPPADDDDDDRDD